MNFLVIIFLLINILAYADIDVSAMEKRAILPIFQFCMFKKTNGTMELAQNCLRIDGVQVVTRCDGITCITKKKIKESKSNPCAGEGSGSVTFSSSALTSQYIQASSLRELPEKMEKACSKGISARVQQQNIRDHIDKAVSRNFKIAFLPEDRDAKLFIDMMLKKDCNLQPYKDLGINYIHISHGPKKWVNLFNKKYETIDEVYPSCE